MLPHVYVTPAYNTTNRRCCPLQLFTVIIVAQHRNITCSFIADDNSEPNVSPLAADDLVAVVHLQQPLLAAGPRARQRSSQQLLTLWIWWCCCCPERRTRHTLMLIAPRHAAAAALQGHADRAGHCVCAWVAVLLWLHLECEQRIAADAAIGACSACICKVACCHELPEILQSYST